MRVSKTITCYVVGLLWVWRLAVLSVVAAEEQPTLLTDMAQVRNLTSVEASRGYSVNVTGIVTYSAPSRALLFVQDSTGGVFVSPQARVWDWRAGQKVGITGVAASGSHLPYISQAVLQDLGTGALPAARPVTFEQLARNTEDGNLVEVRGVVRVATLKEGWLFLELVAEGKRLQAIFSDSPGNPDDLVNLIDAEVRLRAVAGVVSQETNNPVFIQLHASSVDNLEVEINAPEQPLLAPVQAIGSLISTSTPPSMIHRVRVKGELSISPEGRWRVTDSTGAVWIQPGQKRALLSSSLVDVLGFPGVDSGGVVLEDATVNFLALSWPETADSLTNAIREHLPILVEVNAIRRLPENEARRGYPVQVQGVVTYTDQDWRLLFVQDDSAGIFVFERPFTFAGKEGQLVEVTGFSGSGQYAPVIRQPVYKVLGEGVRPRAKPAMLDQLMSGSEDGQYVEVSGVVRYLTVGNNHLTMNIVTAGGLVQAIVPGFGTNRIPVHLIDAEVRVPSVCGSLYTKERQLTGIQLFVSAIEDIQVTKAAPSDPYALPIHNINQLLQFRSRTILRHRVHVCGTVTFRDPRWHTLFIQDENDGLYVRSLPTPNLAVGDLVDVVGFVTPDAFGPVMSEAIFRRIGTGQVPRPIPVTLAQASSGDYDARLVEVEARLVQRMPGTDGRGFELHANEWRLHAFLEGTETVGMLASIREGSWLRLTGVCSLQPMGDQTAIRLCLQLRSAADVVVLKQPPWWTNWHWLALLGLMLIVIGGISAWVVLLRRSVRKQTAIIRARLESEAALEARFRAILDNIPDPAWLKDVSGHYQAVNDAWCRYKGLAESEVLGKTDFDLMASDVASRSRTEEESVAQSGQLLHKDECLEDTQKCRRWFETTLVPILNDQRQVTGTAGIAREVTERKQLEARFLQVQKMEAIGQLAGGVAHDFNNILASITLNLGLLKERTDLDLDTVRELSELEKDAQRAANLTRQLLLFSRRQVLEITRIDLKVLLAGLMKMLGRLLGEHISIDISEPAEPMWVNADSGMLEQLLLNLCVNARDAMPKGGRLKLAIERVRLNAEDIQQQSDGRAGLFVRLSVEDTGYGMDEATKSRAFEPFFTTKEVGKGTGLGLATVYGIAKQHQGWVEVESTLGRGTMFRVYLPAVESSVPIESRERPILVDGGTETILLVEDDESLRRVAKLTLGRYGYHVVEACNGVDALRLWDEHQHDVSLLLTDMVMPEGMNGLELADRLLQVKPSLKVIVSSGYSVDLTPQSIENTPRVKFISKPYTPSALALTVRHCLDETMSY